MRKSISGILFIIIPGLILLLISCTPGSCFEETESYLKASFYDNTTKLIRAPDSLTVYGLNMESDKLYDNAKNVQPVLFPLNASATSSTYIIKINGITDTLEFRYNSYPYLISKECGYTFYHNLDSDRIFTKHAIINIYISKRNITTLNEENIRIFY